LTRTVPSPAVAQRQQPTAKNKERRPGPVVVSIPMGQDGSTKEKKSQKRPQPVAAPALLVN